MSAARVLPAAPLPPLPSAAELAQQLQADAFDGVQNARALRDLARLTHASEAAWLERMGRLRLSLHHGRCDDLQAVAQGSLRPAELEPWPLPQPRLWELLLARLRDEFKQSRHREPRPWQIALALQHGADWLCDAARLARREQHRMRRPVGWRLPQPKIGGEALVAELCDPTPGSGDSGTVGSTGDAAHTGQVLRLTWGNTAHCVVQSRPGRWAEPDTGCEPT